MKYISIFIIGILLIFIAILVQTNIDLSLKLNKVTTSSKFIWNDDEESIPTDGSLIKLEFTNSEGIYIGPYLNGNTQYIIELVNDSIKVIDPQTEKLIYIENFNTNSPLSIALLADNQ